MTDHPYSPTKGLQRWIAFSLIGLTLCFSIHAQDQPVPPARAALPLSDPVMDLDVVVTADRVRHWMDGESRMLLLEEGVQFRMGTYGFKANRAVIRIERELSNFGRVWHLAVYLDQAEPLVETGPVQTESGQLLITATTRGGVTVDKPAVMERVEDAPRVPLIDQALQQLIALREARSRPGLAVPESLGLDEEALARRDRRRAELESQQRQVYQATTPAPAPGSAPSQGNNPSPPDPQQATLSPPPEPTILPASGTVAYTMDSWAVQPGDDRTVVSLIGDVRLVFEDFRAGRVVSLKAEKVVLFLSDEADQPATGSGDLDAGNVQGVYLEDNAIITDGDYTVRAPRVYYDLAMNKATLLDAVFFTYDIKRRVPLYVRAERVRQTSATDFRATNARLSTSEFAVPHFSVGAGEMRVSEYSPGDGRSGLVFDAKDTTFNLGNVPVFYWPRLAGYGDSIPLRSVRSDYSSENGVSVQTEWDMFALTGQPRPENTRWTGEIDYLGEHGPAIGTEVKYDDDRSLGNARGYLLLDDNGEDEIGGRLPVEQDGETRGYALAQHRSYLPGGIELSLEGSYVSDSTFLEEFFPEQAYEVQPYETSAYVKWQQTDAVVDALATTPRLTDFTPQLTRLQSYGYQVEKYPELSYRIIGRSLFDDIVTLYSQTSVSQLRIYAGDDTPGDRGFDATSSNRFFGIAPTTGFDDRLDGLNIPTTSVRRLDSRHEITMPLEAGAIDVTPYAVGRVTAYDDDFAEFNGGNDDTLRLFGEVGLRIGTEFSKSDSTVRSDILDLEGIRHIVRPSATLFVNGSTLNPDDLPVYDPDVEDLAQGSGARVGVTQTWQTRRGGPGRQRTVDWVTWKTDYVYRSSEADSDTVIARFYDYRPEYSRGGDHLYSELLWMVTDTLGLAGQITHSLESDRVEQWRVGSTLDHSPRLQSFLSYEEIAELDTRLLSYGFTYVLTPKYKIGAVQTWDFEGNESRNISLQMDRRLPRWTLRVFVSFDEIEDEQRVGIALVPEGSRGGGRVFGLND
jgi:hypothetical protein